MRKLIPFIFLIFALTISSCGIEQVPSMETANSSPVIQTQKTEIKLSDSPSTLETTVPSVKDIIPTPISTIVVQATQISEPSPDQQIMLDLVMNNLSERMNVPVDQIELISFETVSWPDTSLGCQKPGINVEDLVVPGYRIELTVNDLIFNYHTDTLQKIVLCADDQPFEIYNPP